MHRDIVMLLADWTFGWTRSRTGVSNVVEGKFIWLFFSGETGVATSGPVKNGRTIQAEAG